MLTLLLWLWQDDRCAVKYSVKHANRAAAQLHENLTIPHRILCLTDTPEADFSPLIIPVKLWDDYRDIQSPALRPDKPQCYVRLKAFSRDAAKLLGERIVSIDLDCQVTGNLDVLFDRQEDFIIWRRAPLEKQGGRYQASVWMLRTGSRPWVWEDFKGRESLDALAALASDSPEARHYLIADQGWIEHKLPGAATWGMDDGVYDWRWLRQEGYELDPPSNMKICFFAGSQKPWTIDGGFDDPGWVKGGVNEN